ncbi:MAG: hypothetical protein WC011_00855 [Candidatus Paceibacterota bacterium]
MKHPKLDELFSDLTIIKKVNDALAQMKSETSFEVAEFGEPLTFPDDVISLMYLIIFCENVHFIPGRKPAIGIAAGDYVEHENKKYMYASSGVMNPNLFTLHLAREFEQLMNNWLEVKDEVEARLQKNKVALPQLSSESSPFRNFSSNVGFSHIGTPSLAFIQALEGIREKLNGLIKKERMEDIDYLISTCKEFCNIGESLDRIRNLAGAKSFAFVNTKNGGLELSGPSASGGMSWLQSSSSEIIDAVPHKNSLSFFMMHSHKIFPQVNVIGSGTIPEKSIKFIIPPGIVEQLQSIIDNSESLRDLWKTCEPNFELSDEENKTRFINWAKAVHKTLYTSEVVNIIRSRVHVNVIGIQLDLTEPNQKTVYLRPVTTESFWNSVDKIETSEIENFDVANFWIECADGYVSPEIPLV